MKNKTPVMKDKTLSELYKCISALTNTSETEQLLTDLCTPAELKAMADRWRVVAEIMTGKPYRQIHEETGVSITTITRVARCIHYGAGGYQLMHQKLKNIPKNKTR